MRKVAVVNTFSPKYFPLPINKVLETVDKYGKD